MADLTPADYKDPHVIRRVMRRAKTFAIVGLSPNPQKASHFVATYLRYHGYRIVPVHPTAREVLGEPAYPTLDAIPDDVQIDVVDVFRPAEEAPVYARSAVARGAQALWLQLGQVSEEAARIARAGGLDVVMDACPKMEHGRYTGQMHWVGMNTGVISSRRARPAF